MALKFVKKNTDLGAAEKSMTPKQSFSPKQGATNSNSGGTVSFFKKGAAAKEALQKEEAAAELRAADKGKLWQFWMTAGEARQITFLDGDLDEDGMLDIQMFYQHQLRVNGNWEKFVCTAEADQSQPCPMCESGDRPALVGVMTVIDHTEHKIKKGANAGKTVRNQRKLFVAKQGTLRLLTTMAVKRGGLAGCLFDVTRTGDDEANVGNVFDFTHKFESADEIANQFDMKVEDVVPASYEDEIKYRSPEELIELGVGKKVGGPGFEKGSNLKDEL